MILRKLLIAAVIALPSIAFAQDEEQSEPTDPASEPKKEEVDPLKTKEAEPPKVVSTGKGPFPRIADDEETIYAVQRKAYLVNQKLEATLMFAATFTDRFVQAFAPAGSVSYHVAENFGFELYGLYTFPDESGLTQEILDEYKLTPEVAKLTQMLWGVGLGVQWSPIYGKIQVFGSSLGNFNFYVGAGAGLGQTRVQCTPGLELDPERGFDPAPDGSGLAKCPMVDEMATMDVYEVVYEPSRLQFMGAISGGIRFYFSNTVGLKFEIKDWIFATRVFRPSSTEPTQRFTDAVRNNIFAQVGVSVLFGGEE